MPLSQSLLRAGQKDIRFFTRRGNSSRGERTFELGILRNKMKSVAWRPIGVVTLKSKIVKRLLLAAVLLFAQGWGVHVFAHAPSDRTPPTVSSKPQAPSPAPAATQNPAATVGAEVNVGADQAGQAAVDGGPDDLSADEGMVMGSRIRSQSRT